MRSLMIPALMLILTAAAWARTKDAPPFAAWLAAPQAAEVVAQDASNETEYLGFNWVNSYCFGKLLGCAVTNEPATTNYIYHEVILVSGGWHFYATCIVQVMMIHNCGTLRTPTKISLRKNQFTLSVTNTDPVGTLRHAPTESVYSIISAYHATTKESWGQASAEEWRVLLAALDITQTLKTMPIDDQLAWSRKLSDLRAAGLMNADNLESVLAEMRNRARSK